MQNHWVALALPANANNHSYRQVEPATGFSMHQNQSNDGETGSLQTTKQSAATIDETG